MTIETLKREPCEDAVSRASVFEIMGNLMGIPYECDRQITEKDVSESMDEIRNLPSVTPVRKKSKWITKCHGFPPEPTTVCLKCGFDRDFYIRHIGWDKIKFCPNCGRKIEVEE